MDILTQDDMDARIGSARPLNDKTPSGLPNSLWNVPCPWEPGAFISTEKARRYAAELLQRVAENERAYIKREYDREVERGKALSEQHHKEVDRLRDNEQRAWNETRVLKRRLKNLKEKKR